MTVGSIIFRFLLGATFVSAFAALGSAFKPKTFAGIFGAAPPIALVSLALAFREHSLEHVERLAHSMLAGATALGVYSAACVLLVAYTKLPVWVSAALSWAVWGLAASLLLLGLRW